MSKEAYCVSGKGTRVNEGERVGLMDRREGDRSGVYSKSRRNNGVMGKIWDSEASVVSVSGWWYDSGGNGGMQHVICLVRIALFPILRIETSEDGRCA